MVLIAEITEKKKSLDDKREPEPDSGTQPAKSNDPPPDKPAGDKEVVIEPTTSAAAAAPATLNTTQGNYNEYAMRVAYIMRSYLYMNQTAAAAQAGLEMRCRAMIEVVRKDGGKWVVTKVVPHHTHPLDPPPDPTGSTAGLIPVLGMEFDALSAAKAFYSAYAEKLGFKCKAGAGRRSPDNKMLVMQKFFCSKGFNALNKGSGAGTAGTKRKRGPYKKRVKDDDVVEVVDVESCSEKDGGAACAQADKMAPAAAATNVTAPAGSSEDVGTSGSLDREVQLVGNPGPARLLRELGLKVTRYTCEERKNIIIRYIQKRGNRQAVDRSIKIPSRQALAERRQRGSGGKFLSKQETQKYDSGAEESIAADSSDKVTYKESLQPLQNLNKDAVEEEPELPPEVVANAGGVPIVGMVFDSEEKACEYYVDYAGSVGFSIRKGWWDRSSKNLTRSRMYLCSRAGFRTQNSAKEPRKIRSDPRTGCSAKMSIKITSNGKYRVTEFVPDHNHPLAAPIDIQMLKSQKLLATRQNGSRQTSNLISSEYKNYVRLIHEKDMRIGDAGAILEYLQKMKGENPSFYCAIQVDQVDQMTNIFWADAKSIADYHYFGDVVCFDTAYKASDYDRPLALFLGINHHKQIIIFGAAFLYDETVESLKWLFETFKSAMSGQQPKTILTDNHAGTADAISTVLPGTCQRVSAWHVYQNCGKNLSHIFHNSESFGHDLGHCVFDIEEEEEFRSAWEGMLERYSLKENECLAKLYEEKEKWAAVYDRVAFCADMKNALRGESLSLDLKQHLASDLDLSHFFEQFDRLLDERRSAELQADYHANQSNPRIPPIRFLWQAANAYTPALFEMFQREFDLFVDCVVYVCGEVGSLLEYQVVVKEQNKGHFVRFDSSDGSIICTCKKFEYVGVQCCHVLKVLDSRNIKDLPLHYILKRWRKDAKVEAPRENHAFLLNDDDPKLSLSRRYNSLCRMLYNVAARAVENVEAFALMASQSDQLIEHVEKILQTKHLEKSSVNNASKGQLQSVMDSGSTHHDSSNEIQTTNGKRKKDGSARRRTQHAQEPVKRLKGRRDSFGQSEEVEAPAGDDEPLAPSHSVSPQPRNPSQYFSQSHFVQGPYMTSHQFGVGATQGYTTAQFGQVTPSSTLQQPQQHQQQSMHNNVFLNQGYPQNNIHSLQFTATNPQLDHHGGHQVQSSIPVWDFL